jgi:hypothetical protein
MKCERVQICKFNKQHYFTNFLAKNGKQKYNLIKIEITSTG